jgi:hypothetical protein
MHVRGLLSTRKYGVAETHGCFGLLIGTQKPVFNTGDKVYLLNSSGVYEGPYFVASVPSLGKCTLSLENGEEVLGGQEIATDYIKAA